MSVTKLDERRAAGDELVEDDGGETGDGLSIEDRAAAGEAEEPEDDGSPQLVLEGLGTTLSGAVGGKKPTESLFKTASISLPIAGNVQLPKDTEIWVAMPFAIDEVTVRNRRKNREIVAVSRTHRALPIGQPIILDGPPEGVE